MMNGATINAGQKREPLAIWQVGRYLGHPGDSRRALTISLTFSPGHVTCLFFQLFFLFRQKNSDIKIFKLIYKIIVV